MCDCIYDNITLQFSNENKMKNEKMNIEVVYVSVLACVILISTLVTSTNKQSQEKIYSSY